MEKLKIRYKSLLDAYQTLGEALETIKQEKNIAEKIYEMYRDSLIKRFEFTYDLIWKYLKHFLEVKHGVIANSPKTVFRDSEEQSIITDGQLRTLLKMVDDRNLTSHTYNEKVAEEIAQRIKNYYELLGLIINKTKP